MYVYVFDIVIPSPRIPLFLVSPLGFKDGVVLVSFSCEFFLGEQKHEKREEDKFRTVLLPIQGKRNRFQRT